MTTFGSLIEPLFNQRGRDGAPTGCDVEFARHVFGTLGGQAFEPVGTRFTHLLPELAEDRWRMTTGLFATEERRAVASFSRPIWALPDGLLVAAGNPLGLSGYRAVARTGSCVLAVVRDQVQHRSALGFGVPGERIQVFETYAQAAQAVLDGRAHAAASVARAHAALAARSPGSPLDLVTVAAEEKPPAVGCFAFATADDAFRRAVDGVLAAYLGSAAHRSMMRRFGFSDAEVDLVAP